MLAGQKPGAQGTKRPRRLSVVMLHRQVDELQPGRWRIDPKLGLGIFSGMDFSASEILRGPERGGKKRGLLWFSTDTRNINFQYLTTLKHLPSRRWVARLNNRRIATVCFWRGAGGSMLVVADEAAYCARDGPSTDVPWGKTGDKSSADTKPFSEP